MEGSMERVAKGPDVSDEAELVWDEMRERLMGLTVRQLRQIARDEGICLGYAASRKDTTVAEIVNARRHRAMSGKAVTTGLGAHAGDWCREFGSIRKGAGK